MLDKQKDYTGLFLRALAYLKESGEINNLALKDEVCCLGKVFDSGFNTSKNALKGGVLNPSHTINLTIKPLPRIVFYLTQ